MHESILIYRHFRYLKLALAMLVLSIVAYAVHQPLGDVPNGGTWLGYTLGTIGALLIVWLAWLGIRKRRYGVGRMPLEDWVSAHVYLGSGLLLVATLHTGFQFGWNVHTLAFVLMCLVIFSGMFGVFAYLHYPRLMTENRRGATLERMIAEIAQIDHDMRELALPLGDQLNRVVLQSTEATRISNTLWEQLSGRVRSCANAAAIHEVERLHATDAASETSAVGNLLTLMHRKAALLERARADMHHKALLEIWRSLHIPFTFGLLAALLAHIISVFFYW